MISPTVCADTPARRTRTSAARRTSRIRSGLTPFDLLACRPRRGTWYGPRRPVEGLAARRGDRDDVGLAATYRRMRGGMVEARGLGACLFGCACGLSCRPLPSGQLRSAELPPLPP